MANYACNSTTASGDAVADTGGSAQSRVAAQICEASRPVSPSPEEDWREERDELLAQERYFGEKRFAEFQPESEPMDSYDKSQDLDLSSSSCLGLLSSGGSTVAQPRTCVEHFARELGVPSPDGAVMLSQLNLSSYLSELEYETSFVCSRFVLVVVYAADHPANHIQLIQPQFESHLLSTYPTLPEVFTAGFFVTSVLRVVTSSWLHDVHLYSSQFYKPTRFDEQFTVSYNIESCGSVDIIHEQDVDSAYSTLKNLRGVKSPAGVSLEPGSGKTTVLPFRFAKSKVAVVLPTQFDAFAAYRLATETANIITQELKEDNGSMVTYMDSYTAAFIIHGNKGKFPYAIMIIDESDSQAGITKPLSEIALRGTYIIHLSGTPQDREVLETSGFPVEESDNLPPLTDGYVEAVEFIKARSRTGRGLVMVPNSSVAVSISKMISNSRLISDSTPVEELDSLIADQSSQCVMVADDSCTRGFNLNLDRVFDFSEVGDGDARRNITKPERSQRKKRAGRLKPGAYFYTPVEYSKSSSTHQDVFRHNVARAVFGLPLKPCPLELDFTKLADLMVSDIEPYVLQQQLPALVARTRPKSVSSRTSRTISEENLNNMPAWAKYCSTYFSTSSPSVKSGHKRVKSTRESFVEPGDNFYTSFGSPVDSSSSSSLMPAHSSSRRHSPSSGTPITTVSNSMASFSIGKEKQRSVQKRQDRPPPIDLSLGNMHEWPQALMSMYDSSAPLPRITPGSWRYTSGGGSGVDWIQRLACVIEEGPKYTKPEFEVVCRAWNIMVGRTSYSFAKGKDAWSDDSMITFSLEYFDNYNYNVLL